MRDAAGPPLVGSALWTDTCGIPHVLADLLDTAPGVAEVAAHVKGARRIVATGNGAALYAGLALQHAAWAEPHPRLDVVAVPAGMLAAGAWKWRAGDVPLVVSASGELRDVVELLPDRLPRPWVACTSTPARACTPRPMPPSSSRSAPRRR